MPRFVVLYHDCPADYLRPSHWDFMLEFSGQLRTWALAEVPDSDAQEARTIGAEQLPDHRLEYLEYEGPVSENRGTVSRYDAGEYALLSESVSTLVLNLQGEKLVGNWQLKRDSAALPHQWLFSRT